jgi:hypothetical protein
MLGCEWRSTHSGLTSTSTSVCTAGVKKRGIPLNYLTDHIILCLIKHTMKTYGKVVIQLHQFLTLLLGRLTLGKEPQLPIEQGLTGAQSMYVAENQTKTVTASNQL